MRDLMAANFGRAATVRSSRFAPGTLALLCVLAAAPMFGATFTVNTLSDTNDGACGAICSLRDAIVAANTLSGPDVIVLGSGLTYTLSSHLTVTDSVTIQGFGSTIDAGGLDRAFVIQGCSVTMNSVTVRNGVASGFLSVGGGIDIQKATVVLNNCTITNNSTAIEAGSRDDGGGIAVVGAFDAPSGVATLANLTLNGTTVSGNTAANGGGILCALCALTITNSTISSNIADGGDGGGIDMVGNSSTLSMTSSTLANNAVTGGSMRGGGLSMPFGTSVSTLTLNRIVNNTATIGSAIFNNAGAINGDDDWWGCNYGPGAGGTGCTGTTNGISGPFAVSRYVVLRASKSSPTIPLNATSAVSADLTFDSLNATTSSGGYVPNGISAAFSGTGGTFAAPSEPTSSGIATDVYTAVGPKGTVALNVSVDGQTVSTSINIGYQPFTDDPLVARVTVARAVHVTELRTRIDAIRTHYGLGAFTYASPGLAAGSIIQAQDISDLRTALSQAYTAAVRAVPSFTDAPLSAGTTIKVAHIAEIRAAIIAIE